MKYFPQDRDHSKRPYSHSHTKKKHKILRNLSILNNRLSVGEGDVTILKLSNSEKGHTNDHNGKRTQPSNYH